MLSLQHTNKTKYFHISDELGILKSPIYLDQKIVAYYTFFYQQSQPQEIDKMIIERAALTSSLSLLKERIRFQSEQRVRGSFLEDMISGAWTIEEMTKRAYYLGIKLTPPYRMLAVEAFSQPSFIHKLEFNDEVISALGHYFKDHGINAFIGQKSQNIIILCAGNASLTKQKELQSLSHKISTYLMRKFPQNRFKFGISTLFPYSI